MSILDRIQEPNDIKKIDEKDLPELAQDIREFLIWRQTLGAWNLRSHFIVRWISRLISWYGM